MRIFLICLILISASCQQQPANPSQDTPQQPQTDQNNVPQADQPNPQTIQPIQTDPIPLTENQNTQQQKPIQPEQAQPVQTIQSVKPIQVAPQTVEGIAVEPNVVQSSQNNQNTQQPIVTNLNDSPTQQQTNQASQNAGQTQPSGQNYQNPDPERSAKYRKQQQRIRQMRKSQQKIRNYTKQVKQLTPTQQRKNKQRTQSRQLRAQIQFSIPKKNVMFEIDRGIQQFLITPTANCELFITLAIYTLVDNAYGIIKDIDSSGLLKVYVYEDNSKIVGNGQFYFQKTIRFEGRAHSNYAIRFYNTGVPKLVTMSYPNVLEASHLQKIYNKQKSVYHLWKTEVLSNRVDQVTQKLRRNSMMDKTNNQLMMNNLRKYSGFQIFQVLVVVIIAGFQVHMIKKLFKTDNIL